MTLKINKWILGFLILILVILVYFHFTELSKFVQLIHRINPFWFILALLFQIGTYISLASVWWIVLWRQHQKISFLNLVSLSLSQLFVNQTIPSSGLSGTTLVTQYLLQRKISKKSVALALTLNVFSRQIAYFLVFILAIIILWFHHSLNKPLIIFTIIFTSAIVFISIAAIYLWIHIRDKALPRFLKKFETLKSLLSAIKKLQPKTLLRPTVSLPAICLQGAIFIFDALTLWMVLWALDIDLSFVLVFATQVIAQAVGSITLIPGGLGVFEGSMTGMLYALGLPLESALAATILFRGLTYWLPMLPGFVITNRKLYRS
ncbi:lysylphosphatidylglycerol synthase transmembrane domain-containing protein [Legionella jamestowniensis]|uniref:Integral membrane protein n=1 Tax=Legionella jamestowniensis TaxID=455 RepID=A0A0W0UKZ6_9GAMM|nr:lysylphosphatidylglycerol synthase transmembrane domain-containing protein [Legionella jamestowniensis]KTD08285.1 hypothetical protein Ljam_2480 [Legionella jamestowniensis]OCH98603.1 hypothetical protein A8135_00755 [Legionella jamestowniensis]SFL97289.1 hypothetical protein SAMN02746073_2814 [Legionella jamestowniensis DSM 19215]